MMVKNIVFKTLTLNSTLELKKLKAYYLSPEIDNSFVKPISKRGYPIDEVIYPQSEFKWLVAIHNENIIASRRIMIVKDYAHLSFLSIAPNFRGFGISKELYEKSINIAKSYKPKFLKLKTWNTNTIAIKMATKYGFTQTSEYIDLDNRVDGIKTLEFIRELNY